ncbi:MAG: hypothetical protein GY862_09360 [Gammaproteobacteria bacterium]|nr:hypothetical protein [Gammaproteobacteria bacterium]
MKKYFGAGCKPAPAGEFCPKSKMCKRVDTIDPLIIELTEGDSLMHFGQIRQI